MGLGASVALPLRQASTPALSTLSGKLLLAGNMTAMAGTYLLLVVVLLAGRVPLVERAIGQDKLVRWHRLLAPAPLLLLGAHAVLTTIGYALPLHRSFLTEAVSLSRTMEWVFAGIVAYAMLVGISLVSLRAVRRRMSYDTWWVVHLYTYLALAFSVPHQVQDGTSFLGDPLAKVGWALLWLATAGVVVAYRVLVPAYKSLHHRLEVVAIEQEAPGVISVVMAGRDIEHLAVAGGQYFAWRFLARGLWWHAHPFSLSAMPAPPYLRVTIKTVGDTTRSLARLPVGTRVAFEGPYGAMTDAARRGDKVALVGAGVGITPLRAVLEDLPAGVDVVVVHRASKREHLVHNEELRHHLAGRRGQLVELVGPRSKHRLERPSVLESIVPDLASRDLFVCGPDGFARSVIAAARHIGVPVEAIHKESFAF